MVDKKAIEDALNKIENLSEILIEKERAINEKEDYCRNIEEKLSEAKEYLKKKIKETEKIEEMINEKDEKYGDLKKKYGLLKAEQTKNEQYTKELEQRVLSAKEEYEKLRENPNILKDIYKEGEIMELNKKIREYEKKTLNDHEQKWKYAAISTGFCLLLSLGYIGFNYPKKDEQKSKIEQAASYNTEEKIQNVVKSTPIASNYAAKKSTATESKIRTDADIVREIEALKELPMTDGRAIEIFRLRAEREQLKKMTMKKE